MRQSLRQRLDSLHTCCRRYHSWRRLEWRFLLSFPEYLKGSAEVLLLFTEVEGLTKSTNHSTPIWPTMQNLFSGSLTAVNNVTYGQRWGSQTRNKHFLFFCWVSSVPACLQGFFSFLYFFTKIATFCSWMCTWAPSNVRSTEKGIAIPACAGQGSFSGSKITSYLLR